MLLLPLILMGHLWHRQVKSSGCMSGLLSLLEFSIVCRQDGYITSLSFMASPPPSLYFNFCYSGGWCFSYLVFFNVISTIAIIIAVPAAGAKSTEGLASHGFVWTEVNSNLPNALWQYRHNSDHRWVRMGQQGIRFSTRLALCPMGYGRCTSMFISINILHPLLKDRLWWCSPWVQLSRTYPQHLNRFR